MYNNLYTADPSGVFKVIFQKKIDLLFSPIISSFKILTIGFFLP